MSLEEISHDCNIAMGDVTTVYATFSLLSYDGGQRSKHKKHWILPGILFAFFLHLYDINCGESPENKAKVQYLLKDTCHKSNNVMSITIQ